MLNLIPKTFLSIILLAVLLRLTLMPFLFHPDLKTQAFHANFLSSGVVNIYQFINENKNSLSYRDTFNYPPLSYFLIGSLVTIEKPLLRESLPNWLRDWSETWFTSDQIFRLLFILKIPYLIFDLLIGFLLFRMVDESKKKLVLIFWFFNPLNLYIIYGISNFDVITTFFLLLSLFFYQRKNYFISGLSFGTAVATKLFPLLLLPLFLINLLPGKNLKQILKFATGVVVVPVVTIGPFFNDFINTADRGLTLKILESKLSLIGFSLPVVLIFITIAFLVFLYQSFKAGSSAYLLNSYITVVLLITLSFTTYHPQWLIWVMPFLVIMMAENLSLSLILFPLTLSFILNILSLQDNFLTLGIFSPILPNIYEVDKLGKTIFARVDKESVGFYSKLFMSTSAFIIFVSIVKKINLKFPSSFLKFYQRNLLVIYLTLSMLSFLSILIGGLLYSAKAMPAFRQLKNDTTFPLYLNHDLSHELITKYNNINQVSVKLKNVGFANQDQFVFSILDRENNVIRQVIASGSNISDDDMATFKFDPIPNSGSMPLTINLHSESPKNQSNILASISSSRGMVLKVTYQDNFLNALQKLLLEFLKRFFQDTIFVTGYLSIILAFGILYLRIRKYDKI